MANEAKIMNMISYDSVIIDAMSEFYVIAFKDLHDDYKMYIGELVSHSNFTSDFLNIGNENIDKTRTEIANRDKQDGNWSSQYGEIDSVVSLRDLIITYSEIKDEYTYDDINEIVEKYKEDYITLMGKDKVKKLELK